MFVPDEGMSLGMGADREACGGRGCRLEPLSFSRSPYSASGTVRLGARCGEDSEMRAARLVTGTSRMVYNKCHQSKVFVFTQDSTMSRKSSSQLQSHYSSASCTRMTSQTQWYHASKSQSTPNKNPCKRQSQPKALLRARYQPHHTPHISSSKNLINVRAPDTPSPIKG